MIKAIIFDLDDTLYPFEEYVESGFKAVARYAGEKYGVDPEHAYAYMKILYSRYGEREIFSRAVCYFDLDASSIIELTSVFRNHSPDIVLFPKYRRALDELGTYYTLGLLAEGEHSVQEKKLKALRIRRHFKNILFTGAYDEAKRKPNPFCFNLMARILRLQPQEVVYVGDNPLTDFLGAKKAGYITLRVMTGAMQNKNVPMEFEAHCRIKDITEIRSCLNEQF